MSVQSFVREYALWAYTFEGGSKDYGGREDYFIANLIHKYMHGKRILDLGCGPIVPVTSVFYQDAKEIVGVDLLQANLDFVRKHADVLEPTVNRARAYKHRYLSRSDAKPRVRLVRGDVTKRLNIGKFDSAMQLGCFGCLDTEKQFQTACDNAYAYLKKGGTLLMVTWLDGEVKKVDRKYHFNGDVNAEKLYVPCLEKAGFKILEIHKTSSVLSNDSRKMGYTKVMWAVAKKS